MDLLQSVCRTAVTSTMRTSLVTPATQQPFRKSLIFIGSRPYERLFSSTRAALDHAPKSTTAGSRLSNVVPHSALPPRPPPPTPLSPLSPPSPLLNKAITRVDKTTFPLLDPANDRINPNLQSWSKTDFDTKWGGYARKEPTVRLKPSTGRTVNLTAGFDFTKAIRRLEQNCSRESIRRLEHLQRAHERPALRRKRQKRERWRQRFDQGVNAAIIRTRQLQAQGW